MMAVGNWSIRTRLILAFAALSIPYLLACGVGVIGFRALSERTEDIQHEVAIEVRATVAFQQSLFELVYQGHEYLTTGGRPAHGRLEKGTETFRNALARLQATNYVFETERGLLKTVADRGARLDVLSHEILDMADPLRDPSNRQKTIELIRLREEASEALTKLLAIGFSATDEEIEETTTLLGRLTTASVSILLFGMVTGVIVSLLFSKWLTLHIRAIALGSQRLAGGDLSHRVEVGAGAELGDAARAFNAMAERLQHSHAALAARNAELDSFVYSVSHDLKAPLVTIQGMAGVLVEDFAPHLPPEGRHYVERIQANTQQMDHLILDLLTLSRIGREAHASERVHLAELIDEVVAGFAEPISARGIKVSQRDLGTLWGVRVQLEQVFSNLLGNAVKYLGDTPSPAIEIGSVERGAFVECYVTDNGIGIDPAYHDKVFEIFQRLKEVEAPGTGVGLAIVKKIVEGAGGRIWVESAPGQGATFRFTWPTPPREELS